MVDTCGWIAVINAGINIDHAFSRIFGRFQFIVIDSVWDELRSFQDKNRNKNILLELLMNKSTPYESKKLDVNHTDDIILFLSMENSWPVLTIDKKLKERLNKSNCKIVQVVGEKKIELI